MDLLNKAIKILDEKGMLLYLSLSGSHLHGTNTENSDTDVVGVYLPTISDMLLGKELKPIKWTSGSNNSKNNTGDIDITLFPLHTFLKGISRSETNSLDLLFSYNTPSMLVCNDDFQDIVLENHECLINKFNVKPLVGFSVSMAYRYVLKGERANEVEDLLEFLNNQFETKKEAKEKKLYDLNLKNFVKDYKYLDIIKADGSGGVIHDYLKVLDSLFLMNSSIHHTIKGVQQIVNRYGKRTGKAQKNGADFKALSHAYRTLTTALEFKKYGKITYPRPDKELLLAIKQGELNLEEVSELIESKLEEINLLETKNVKVDLGYVDDLILKMYKEIENV